MTLSKDYSVRPAKIYALFLIRKIKSKRGREGGFLFSFFDGVRENDIMHTMNRLKLFKNITDVLIASKLCVKIVLNGLGYK